MDNFRQVFEPVVRYYNRYLYDPYMVDVTQYKGGSSVGSDWVSRHFQTHLHHIKDKFYGLQRRFNEVVLGDLLEDNWFRLLVLNGFDRVATIRQAYPALRTKFFKPSSVSFAFTEVTNGGIFGGWFRGALVNTFQFSSVVFPALYLSNTYDFGFGKLAGFLGWLTVFDAIMFPLDKVKTVLYADTRNEYKSNRCSNSEFSAFGEVKGLKSAYAGLGAKLIFNIPWACAAYTTVNDSPLIDKVLSWAAVAFFYPLNGIKTVHQLKNTVISTPIVEKLPMGVYRGFLPFVIANALGGVVLHNLTGQDRQASYASAFGQDIHFYDQNHHYPIRKVL